MWGEQEEQGGVRLFTLGKRFESWPRFQMEEKNPRKRGQDGRSKIEE